MRQSLKQASHLISTFSGTQPKVRDDDAYGLSVDRQVCINGPTRFASGDTQVEEATLEYLPAREQHIAEGACLPLNRMPSDGLEPRGFGQKLHLARWFPTLEIGAHLLQANQLCVQAAEHSSDTLDVTAAIHADALVDVIGNRRKCTAPAGWNCDIGVAHIPSHLELMRWLRLHQTSLSVGATRP